MAFHEEGRGEGQHVGHREGDILAQDEGVDLRAADADLLEGPHPVDAHLANVDPLARPPFGQDDGRLLGAHAAERQQQQKRYSEFHGPRVYFQQKAAGVMPT